MLSLSQSAVATGSNSRHSSEVQTDNGLQAKTYEDEASDLCQDSSRVDLTGIRRKLLGRQATLATTSKLSTVCSRYHSNHGAATSGGHNQAGVCVRVCVCVGLFRHSQLPTALKALLSQTCCLSCSLLQGVAAREL